MANNVCPYCDEILKCILYTDLGRKVWDGKKWEEDKNYGELEFRCPQCGVSIEYPELERMGVI